MLQWQASQPGRLTRCSCPNRRIVLLVENPARESKRTAILLRTSTNPEPAFDGMKLGWHCLLPLRKKFTRWAVRSFSVRQAFLGGSAGLDGVAGYASLFFQAGVMPRYVVKPYAATATKPKRTCLV